MCDGFDFPVGKPNAVGYYKARGYWPNGHLGEDWNGKGGGDTDLGDPVYAAADGVVVLSQDVKVGWGNVVIIRHALRESDGTVKMVDTLYGHLDVRKVVKDQIVKRGQIVGTIGTAHGHYPAHLHFEIRKNLEVGMNRSSFPRDNRVYYSGTTFINERRQLSGGRSYPVPVDTFGAYQPSTTPTPGRTIPTREGSDPKADEMAKKRAALDKLVEDNKKKASEGLSDKDEDSFWARLKGKLKNGAATPGTPAKP